MARALRRILPLLLALASVVACGGDGAAGTAGGEATDDAGGRGGIERDTAGIGVDTTGDVAPDATDAASDVVPDAGLDASGDVGEAECVDDGDCDDGVFCNGRERCSLGRCFGTTVDPCDDGVPCTTDVCDEDDDVCVTEADDALCPDGQVCDPKSGCYLPAECETDADCDDGVVCNGDEICVDDVCAPGAPVVCDDGVSCTVDACVEPSGTCQHTPLAALCPPTDVCDPRDDCVPRPPCASDEECIDAFFCNGTEFCGDDGLCQPGPAPEIDDGLGCTLDACSEELGLVTHTPIDIRCSDGQFCNGPEVCHPVDGCGPGTPPALSDGNACTDDRCDEDADFIEHVPNDALCDDGLFCNGAEACHPADGCVGGEPPLVNDGVGCTVDACSEVEGAVIHTPQDALCADDRVCNGDEVCDAEVGCVAGDDLALDDGIACTVDLCDEEAGGVVHLPDDSLCDNGLFCDGAERCDAMLGCVAGEPPVVDDGVGCTLDTCDEDADRVVHAPDDTVCDNGLFCDGAEVCDPVRDCVAGDAPVLTDGVGCTIDRCNEALDRVDHVPDDTRCDNGLFCDGRETCNATLDCQVGAAPAVSDGIPCTIDRCNEATDAIEHEGDDALCDNGTFCDGDEVCTVGVGCERGADRPDGTECGVATRRICIDGACGGSTCGDGYVDVLAGEECDDGGTAPGDGCDADCLEEEPVGGDCDAYAGTWTVRPALSYSCVDVFIGIPVVDFTFSSLIFTGTGGSLAVTGGPVAGSGAVDTGACTFTATGTVPGGCSETYTITGTFTGPDRFFGEYTATYTGSQCGLSTCTNQRWEITGTR